MFLNKSASYKLSGEKSTILFNLICLIVVQDLRHGHLDFVFEHPCPMHPDVIFNFYGTPLRRHPLFGARLLS